MDGNRITIIVFGVLALIFIAFEVQLRWENKIPAPCALADGGNLKPQYCR
jgi:hypothetical protein